MSIVIVGASVAGIRTAQALRMYGYPGRIAMIGEESHHPYDKPPLSKQMLHAAHEGGNVALLSINELATVDVDLQLGTRAVGLDTIGRRVRTEDGREFEYSELVIATGVVPRSLPGKPLSGVHTMRTADDSHAVRAALTDARQVVVVGAGFIGAEFASAARDYGCTVTMVEMQDVPMANTLGAEVGSALVELHRSAGVEMVTGVGVDHLEGTDRVQAVVVTDGRVFAADLVVVGIGTRPATQWLQDSGLPIDDGVDCDEHLRVIGFPGIHAAGDVARWMHPHYGSPMRIEHWTNANEHGAIVAADILGKPEPSAQVPYVWSDQYGHRIQIAGRPALGKVAKIQGDASHHLVALYGDDAGTAIGVVVVDDPRSFMKLRKAIAKRAQVDTVELPPIKIIPAAKE